MPADYRIALEDLIDNLAPLWESEVWQQASVMTTVADLPELGRLIENAKASFERGRDVLSRTQESEADFVDAPIHEVDSQDPEFSALPEKAKKRRCPKPAEGTPEAHKFRRIPRDDCAYCGAKLTKAQRGWCKVHAPKSEPFPGTLNLSKRENGYERYLARLEELFGPRASTTTTPSAPVSDKPLAVHESGVANWAVKAHARADARRARLAAPVVPAAEVQESPPPVRYWPTDLTADECTPLDSIAIPEGQEILGGLPAYIDGEKYWVRVVLERTAIVEPWPQGAERSVVVKGLILVDRSTIRFGNLPGRMDQLTRARRGRQKTTEGRLKTG